MDELVLQQRRAVIDVPEDVIDMTITCHIWRDGVAQTVQREYSLMETREALRKGDDYIDENDTFSLTDEGRAYVERMLNGEQ